MKPATVIVVGDGWTGAVFAHALAQQGQNCELWTRETAGGPEAVYVGNGETRQKAGLIFGEPLAEQVWAVSEGNYARAGSVLAEMGVPFEETALERPGLSTPSPERALGFDASALERALAKKHPAAGHFQQVISVKARGPLGCTVTLETEAGHVEREATMAVVVSEAFDRDSVAWLHDKRIPVSLSSFTTHNASPRPALTLFNGGADFAFAHAGKLRLGSFRNLFSDRGVGLHTKLDETTRQNVVAFFEGKGWLPAGAALEAQLRWESVSCDGLPIVGSIPGLPSAVFATGFAARGPCFLFEIAQRAAHLITGKRHESFGAFSPRRLL